MELPRRMRGELWPWVIAVGAFEHGDPEPLGILVVRDQPIPDELRPFVKNIVSGKRKPGPKGARSRGG